MAVAAPELLESINPATLEPVGSVERTAPERVAVLAASAARAQEAWGRTGLQERAGLLRACARVLLARADEIVETVAAETGKPPTEALVQDVYAAVDHARWLERNLERVLRRERLKIPQLSLKAKHAWLAYEPLGVVAVISPWNIPFAIPFTEVATAVAAGNGVVLKPSELTPLSGAWVDRVLAEAGAPAGLVQVAQGAGEVGRALVLCPAVAKVFFTGSVEVGRGVASAAGARGCPVVLELGGKDPMIVFADADLERAVDGALSGAFLNCGQACVSVERIYVERPRKTDFAELLAGRARGLELGRELGPLISERQRAKVEGLVDDALARGAHALTGGQRADTGLPGWFYEPTVLVDTPPDARLAREEIFGPVVTVEPFDGEEDAVRLANDGPFGLGASVWTGDLPRARRVADRIETGMVWVNDYGYSFATGQASWGGAKSSGFGRTKSRHGLYECARITYVDEDRGRVRPAWWYPYDAETTEALRAALEVLYGDHRLRAAWRHRRALVRLGRRSLGR